VVRDKAFPKCPSIPRARRPCRHLGYTKAETKNISDKESGLENPVKTDRIQGGCKIPLYRNRENPRALKKTLRSSQNGLRSGFQGFDPRLLTCPAPGSP
jgi:hypothetical protein